MTEHGSTASALASPSVQDSVLEYERVLAEARTNARVAVEQQKQLPDRVRRQQRSNLLRWLDRASTSV